MYQPLSAAPFACRGVFSRPVQEFGSNVVTNAVLLSVAASDVPAPRRGDLVVLTAPLQVGNNTLSAGQELKVEKREADETLTMFDLTLSLP